MDPNETVHRLLTQDTFHEVKSKREKKKEVKGIGESRSQKLSNNSSGRGVNRGVADHAGRSAAQINYDDSEVTRGKLAQIKDNGARSGHTSSGRTTNNSPARSVAPSSYNDVIGSTIHFPGLSDSISSPSPSPSSTLQHNWGHGQLSMADIVKMGRHLRKPSSTSLVATEVCSSSSSKAVVPNPSQGCVISTTNIQSEAKQEVHFNQDNALQSKEVADDPSIVVSQHEPLEEWTLVDHLAEETSPVIVDVSCASSVYHEPSTSSSLHIHEIDSHLSSHVDDIQQLGHISAKDAPTESIISEGQVSADSSCGSSCLEDNSSSYQQHEAEDFDEELSSATANLQHLSLHKEEHGATSTEENPAVIIPGHLQVTNADCSHLSFGSFGSGVGASVHGACSSNPAKTNLEVTGTENASPVDYSDTRNPEYYSSEQLRTPSDDGISPITGASSRNYDIASTSQPEFSRDDTSISEEPRQYNIPSVSSYAFSGTMQPDDAAYNRAQANTQMQNLAPLTSLTQPQTDSTTSNILAGNAQPLREPDLPFSHLLGNQSMPTKYSPSVSSFSGPTISMPEVLKSGLFSNFQSIPQTASNTTISSGPALPPYLPFPSYSQPTLPPGPLTNMFNYPVHPQSIAYMPFSGNSAIHQSPASLQSAGMKYALPQFKSSMSLNGLPQSLPVGSGYGGFGGSSNIPGAFLQNPSNVSVGPAIGYEEALMSQYKESIPLHQGENWLSRTLPAVPSSSFYGIQGPSQQGSSTLRQGPQPTNMGMMGYPNLYHSQLGGISREHQPLSSQGNLNGSQGQSSQQSHHLWQHGY